MLLLQAWLIVGRAQLLMVLVLIEGSPRGLYAFLMSGQNLLDRSNLAGRMLQQLHFAAKDMLPAAVAMKLAGSGKRCRHRVRRP